LKAERPIAAHEDLRFTKHTRSLFESKTCHSRASWPSSKEKAAHVIYLQRKNPKVQARL